MTDEDHYLQAILYCKQDMRSCKDMKICLLQISNKKSIIIYASPLTMIEYVSGETLAIFFLGNIPF